MGKKEETANADELMETLKAMDGRKVGLGEMQVSCSQVIRDFKMEAKTKCNF